MRRDYSTIRYHCNIGCGFEPRLMKGIRRLFPILLLLGGLLPHLFAQDDGTRWQHMGPDQGFVTGTASESYYARKVPACGAPVIVAVLDSGIDTGHADLQGSLWINRKEIPDNGLDDDGNGYPDDRYGWNFLGSPDGRSVVQESFEVTRVYAAERARWTTADTNHLRGKDKKQYAAFLERKTLVETKRRTAEESLMEATFARELVTQAIEAARSILAGDSINIERLEASGDEHAQLAAAIIRNIEEQGIRVPDLDWLVAVANEQFQADIAENTADLECHYNPDFDARQLVGDNAADPRQRIYGNPHVDGSFAFHGTHVAGIIGAMRENGLGIDGIADHVRIMAVKVVPDGDERDKDVANGIRYAVDNGAQVINMSFGKGYSPQKDIVDEAMQYAERHDVLLVIGAGNEGDNLRDKPKFPNDTYLRKPLLGPRRARNVMSVGALAPEAGENCIASFSNYGNKEVDVFAPGVFIYSTTPDGGYDFASGTSMASPVVAGLAALIRSRYPALSAVQVKNVIMRSCRPLPEKVINPGTAALVKRTSLCRTGGMVDVPGAMALAATIKGKARSGLRKFDPGTTPATKA